MIKKYQDFINEVFDVSQNDPTEVASDKNSLNNLEENIKEFLTKKTIVDSIYATYKDEKDLVSKLFAQKFIPLNTSDKKKITFTNPLIGMYAQIADKRRELKGIEDELESQKSTLSQRQTTIAQNPDTSDSLKDDIAYTQTKITDINTRIANLKDEISNLEKSSQLKLKQMKLDLTNSKNRLDHSLHESMNLSGFDSEAIESFRTRHIRKPKECKTTLESLENMSGRDRNLILYYYEAGFLDGKGK